MTKMTSPATPLVIDLCDASTVVNVNLQKETRRSKKKILESDIDLGDDQCIDRVDKVESWLKHHMNLHQQAEESIEDSEWWSTHTWLSKDSQSDEFKDYIASNKKRLRVFLVTTTPELGTGAEPLDMVSGYCYAGCKGLHPYSKIQWTSKQAEDVPVCPNNTCVELGSSRELMLTFMVELRVMDQNGYHGKLNLCREQADQFFGCTVSDFLNNRQLRQEKCEILKRYELLSAAGKPWTPLMDVTVVPLKKTLFVVDSRLRVPVL